VTWSAVDLYENPAKGPEVTVKGFTSQVGSTVFSTAGRSYQDILK
jgi:hypothetical protein